MSLSMAGGPAGAGEALDLALVSAWQVLAGFGTGTPRSGNLFAYFRSVDEVLTELKKSGGADAVEAVMTHIDYLANKAGCRAATILGGGEFSAYQQVIVDALTHINTILQTRMRTRTELLPEGIPEDVFGLILEAEATLVGWCSREKALTIAQIVLRERPRTCVEIGIFGGRSLVPCAAALRHIGAGEIYGIEAWSPEVAIENATNEVNDAWWSQVDFAAIKHAFYRFVAATGLTRQVRLIEAPSGRAATLFDQIDFLHIDGSHSIVNAAEDVILYVRKVRSGGIVVFDDINWRSTAPARALLASLCDTVMMMQDPSSGLDVCAVLRRR
jgi:predicted O-methyltransferase YrrM